MFEINYDPDLDQITIHGTSADCLLRGNAGTILSVILDYKLIDNNTLVTQAKNRAGERIAETVKALKNTGISSELSSTSKQVIENYICYLKAFRDSSVIGHNIHNNPPTNISLPSSFVRKLKPFQIPSVNHLSELKNSANFSVPGSGKTTMVLAAYSILKQKNEVTKILVICPRSAFEPWNEEFEGCFGAIPSTLRIAGLPQERKNLLANTDSFELFLCTYQMLPNEIEAVSRILRKYPCLLVLDEAHHIKRGEGGVWYNAVYNIAPLAHRRIILTGTPAPNQIDDIIPQFEILWPKLNPAKGAMDLYNENENIDDFRRALEPYYVRVRKDQLELPARNIALIPVKLGDLQKRIYNILCNRILVQNIPKLEGRYLIRDLRKALVVRLLQASTNPTLLNEYSNEFRIPPLSSSGVDLDQLIRNYSKYETPQKLVYATNLAKSLAEDGRKSIIWTSFVHNAELLYKLVRESGIDAVLVTGSTAKDESVENNRDFLIHQFKTNPSTMVLVATIPAISESVSLHKECHDAIYVDRTFNCGIYMQSLDRIHRVGLSIDTKVTYYILLGSDTLDEVVHSRLKYKMKIMHRILNDDIDILDLDVPEDLSMSDWDDYDIRAILDHIHQYCSK